MYSHTKKVGSVGRYGVRIGRRLRNEIKKVEDDAKKSNFCPSCGKKKVKRASSGIWQCKSCDTKFVGGAYISTHKRISMEEKE